MTSKHQARGGDRLSRQLLAWVELAPVDLQRRAEQRFLPLSYSDGQDLIKRLEALAVFAAGVASYLDARSKSMGSDQGHDQAVRELNRTRRTVRKALGYGETHDLRI